MPVLCCARLGRLESESSRCQIFPLIRRCGKTSDAQRPVSSLRLPLSASQNWYDLWYPNLAPSAELVKQAQAATDAKQWAAFVKAYKAEMATPDNSRNLDLLAALSHQTNLSVGCYCEDEAHCHRSVLRQLLSERGAEVK